MYRGIEEVALPGETPGIYAFVSKKQDKTVEDKHRSVDITVLPFEQILGDQIVATNF
jgi:hypothetical protein